MPVFEVTVRGRGFRVPMDNVEVRVFFRLVRVVAADQVSAEAAALSIVRTDWELGPNARLNGGAPPSLRVESVSILPWWHRFLRSRLGYIFAPGDDEADAV